MLRPEQPAHTARSRRSFNARHRYLATRCPPAPGARTHLHSAVGEEQLVAGRAVDGGPHRRPRHGDGARGRGRHRGRRRGACRPRLQGVAEGQGWFQLSSLHDATYCRERLQGPRGHSRPGAGRLATQPVHRHPPTLQQNAAEGQAAVGGQVEQLRVAAQVQHWGGAGQDGAPGASRRAGSSWLAGRLAGRQARSRCARRGIPALPTTPPCWPPLDAAPLGRSSFDSSSTWRPCSTMGRWKAFQAVPAREMCAAGRAGQGRASGRTSTSVLCTMLPVPKGRMMQLSVPLYRPASRPAAPQALQRWPPRRTSQHDAGDVRRSQQVEQLGAGARHLPWG